MPFDRLESDGWNFGRNGAYTVCHRKGCHRWIFLDPPSGDGDPTYPKDSEACVVVQGNAQHPYCSPGCLALEAVAQLAEH